MVQATRDQLGFGFHLLHDAHHRLTPIEAGRLGKSIEPYRMFWLEDATPAEDQAAFRLIRQHTVTPLAVGEVFNTIWDCQTLITEPADRLHPPSRPARRRHHTLRRIFDLADLYGVRSGSHGPATSHRSASPPRCTSTLPIPNFGIQEYMAHLDPRPRCSSTGYTLPRACCT